MKKKVKKKQYGSRGRGYYNDFETMLIGMREGLEEALEATAERLCAEMDDIIIENIYNTPEGQYYKRTEDMAHLEGYMTYEMNGLSCTFMINGETIETLEPENPPHHALETYSGESFLQFFSPDHQDFLFNCKRFIEDKYEYYYQQECRKRGLFIK